MMSAKFFFVPAAFMLFGCSSMHPITVERSPVVSKLDADLEKTSSALHHYLVGELSIKKDDLPGAISNLNKASELSEKPSAELSGSLAELELRSGNIDKAFEESTKALEAAPDDAHILSLHAGILDALGRTEESIGFYKRALSAAPDAPEYVVLLSALLSKENRSAEAVSELTAYLRKHDSDAIVHFYLGRTLEIQGDLKSAALHMKKARELQKDNINLSLEYVRVLLKQHRLGEAKAVCSEILKKDPEHKLARKVMAQLLVGENKLEEALKHFEVLEKIEEDATDSQMSIALIQLERKNYDDAIRELNLILAKDDKNTDARYALATGYAGKGNFQQAAEALMEIPSGDKNFERARTYAAFIYRQLGEFEKAENALTELIDAKKTDPSVIMYLAELYKEQGKLEEARDTLEDLVQTSTDNDRLLYEYAVISYRLKDADTTRKTIERILEINPNNAEALNFLAYDMSQTGEDLPAALGLAKRAIIAKPNDGYILDTLGWIQFKMGDVKAASDTLKRAVSIVNDDPVVLEHYADILAAAGNQAEAQKIYKSIDPEKANDDDGRNAARRAREKIADR